MPNTYGAVGYVWDRKVKRWRSKAGQFTKPADVKTALGDVTEAIKGQATALSQSFTGGGISLAEWQLGMTGLVKQAHLAAALSAGGGADGWNSQVEAALADRLAVQWQHLDQFVAGILDGTQALNGTLGARAGQYIDSAGGTFEEVRRAVTAAPYERRFLAAGSASCNGCIAQAGLGWQPAGVLKSIGDCDCVGNCNCYFGFSQVALS